MNTPFNQQSSAAPQTKLPPQAGHALVRAGIILLVSILLIGGLLLANLFTTRFGFHTTSPLKPANPSKVALPDPTATPISARAGSLYTVATGSLTRIDLQTAQTVWTINATSPATPLVMDNSIFFDNEDSSNPFLEAIDGKTGQQLWRSSKYPNGFLLGSEHTLYDSTCDPFTTINPCVLYSINARNGATIWSYNLPNGNAWIALQDGVLYGVSYTSYFALNAANGVPIWQQNLLNYTDQEANMTPVVSGDVLSFASCNVTKQSTGFAGCYLYAFNTHNGKELWHMPTTNSIEATPTIMAGVVYAGTIEGTIYAVSEKNGQQIWTVTPGGTIGQLVATADTLYVEVIESDGQTLHIVALNTATHTPRWGLSSLTVPSTARQLLVAGEPHAPTSAGPASHPFVLAQGLIYIQSGPDVVSVIRSSDGSDVTQYTLKGSNSIYGFTVAFQ